MLERVLQNPCCLELGHLRQRIHELPVGTVQHNLAQCMLNVVLGCRTVLELGYTLYIVRRLVLVLLGSMHCFMHVECSNLLGR